MTTCLLFFASSPFLKKINSNKKEFAPSGSKEFAPSGSKEFAPSGSKFFLIRADPFFKKGTKQKQVWQLPLSKEYLVT